MKETIQIGKLKIFYLPNFNLPNSFFAFPSRSEASEKIIILQTHPTHNATFPENLRFDNLENTKKYSFTHDIWSSQKKCFNLLGRSSIYVI